MPAAYRPDTSRERYYDKPRPSRGKGERRPDHPPSHHRRYDDELSTEGPTYRRRPASHESRHNADYEAKRRPTSHESRHNADYEAKRRPPPRRHRHADEHRRGEYDGLEEEFSSRRRRPDHRREDDYYSDSTHNRPRRDSRDARAAPPARRRGPDEYRRDRPAKPVRKESKWEKEAKDMFMQYAMPAIKAEAGRYATRKLGKMMGGQGAR